jgi:tetrapyrrole methylase family protein / MazG family protein
MSDEPARIGGDELSRLLIVLRELRQQCPWDREQNIASLGKNLVEEAYESLDAIERDDTSAIVDELGDLLAQILAIAVIGEETQRFRIAEIFQWAADKLVRRHPHVYGDAAATTSAEVLDNWNRIKQEERKNAGATSALDGIARSMPSLARAEKLGSRARQAGMDWHDIHDVLAKVREEMDEVEGALAENDTDAAAGELGDMLLALANAPRFIDHSAEETLRRACDKFTGRFAAVERIADTRGLDLKQLRPDEIDALWNEAKRISNER